MAFNVIKIKGKCILDNVRLQNYKLTKVEMDNIDNLVPQPWNAETIFITNFEDTLYDGNVVGWRLKRKLIEDPLFQTIGDFHFNDLSYIDKSVINRHEYMYSIHPLVSGGEGAGIENSITPDFYGWFLFDENNIYKFDMGFNGTESDSIQTVEDVHIYNNYTKYPVFSFGKRKYKRSAITTMPYSFNNYKITFDISLLKEIESFINNDNYKYLKNTASEIYKVTTTGFNYDLLDNYEEQPFTINFSWTEIGDV